MSTLKRAILFLFPYLILAVCILEERWRIQAASLMQYDTYTDMLTLTAVICTLFLFFYIRNIMEKYDGIVLLFEYNCSYCLYPFDLAARCICVPQSDCLQCFSK